MRTPSLPLPVVGLLCLASVAAGWLCCVVALPVPPAEESHYAAMVDADYGDVADVVFVRAIDGDTFIVDIPTWPKIAGSHISVRVFGLDCPELHDHRKSVRALAEHAKEYTQGRLQGAQHIELRQLRRDKYFRLLANVVVPPAEGNGPPVSLGDELLFRGLAKRYDGGTKSKW